jgi:hypothetical protein
MPPPGRSGSAAMREPGVSPRLAFATIGKECAWRMVRIAKERLVGASISDMCTFVYIYFRPVVDFCVLGNGGSRGTRPTLRFAASRDFFRRRCGRHVGFGLGLQAEDIGYVHEPEWPAFFVNDR